MPPIEVSSSSPSNDSITLSWSPIGPAVKYTLTVYKFGSNTHMKHNSSSTNLTIPGLDAGSLYTVAGHAWDLEGREGEKSSYINQTTRKTFLHFNPRLTTFLLNLKIVSASIIYVIFFFYQPLFFPKIGCVYLLYLNHSNTK